MIFKHVLVHKMYEEFHRYPRLSFTGEFDENSNLINLTNSYGNSFERILGTYQWKMDNSDDVYFVEEDAFYKDN